MLKGKGAVTPLFYHLAHNERDPATGTPTPRNIYNFGRADKLDRDVPVRLCRSIARICGVNVLDPLESEDGCQAGGAGLPDDMQLIRTVELGPLVVIQALWERLGIGEALRHACTASGCKVPYERAVLAMTAYRLCEPESKLGVWDRWLPQVFLPSCQGFKLAHWNGFLCTNAFMSLRG